MTNIRDMKYRTKTYIAGDWDGDKDAIEQLHKWNSSKYWGLSFVDVHEFTSSKDSSLNCSIKKSLAQRMDISKTFVLIVGEHTNTVTSGACSRCKNYINFPLLNIQPSCSTGHTVSNLSYIKYECKLAKTAYDAGKIKIVVLYNSSIVAKSKCPEEIRNIGTHLSMKSYSFNPWNHPICQWDYQAVRKAIEG